MPQLFPHHPPYENFIYKYDECVATETSEFTIPTEIHCKKFMYCSYQPEGYVDLDDILDSLTLYTYLNDKSGMERYSITDMGENKFYVDLPVWKERFY